MHAVQFSRTTRAADFHAQWYAPFSRYRPPPPTPQLQPAEGWVTPAQELHFADPLGMQRMRHDVAVLEDGRTTTMDEVIREQAELLRPHMDGDPSDPHQAEYCVTDEGVIRIVNKVATIYTRPLGAHEHALEMDEESEYGTHEQTVEQAKQLARRSRRITHLAPDMEWDQVDDDGDAMDIDDPVSVTTTNSNNNKPPASKHQQPPSIISLRFLQRRWLSSIGYSKNKVGTSINIHYAQPWTSTQEAFTTGRVLSMGGKNRRNDRAVLTFGTVPYMHRPLSSPRLLHRARRFGAVRRISQNIVASRRLPPGQEICLGLLCKQFEGGAEDARVPLEFNSIVIKVPEFGAFLLPLILPKTH